jgi:hypothetical protein
VVKELVLKTSAPSTPKGRVLKRAAAVKARMPVVGRMVVCISRRKAFEALADQSPKLLTKHVRNVVMCLTKTAVDSGGRRKEKKRPPQTDVSDSFQEGRSDSERSLRRDMGPVVEERRDCAGLAGWMARKCCIRRGNKYKTRCISTLQSCRKRMCKFCCR